MQLEELRNLWTKVFGIHGPQWMIVMALCRLARGEGVHVQAIADLLQVNPTFVTSQSRYLESKGLIQRKRPARAPRARFSRPPRRLAVTLLNSPGNEGAETSQQPATRKRKWELTAGHCSEITFLAPFQFVVRCAWATKRRGLFARPHISGPTKVVRRRGLATTARLLAKELRKWPGFLVTQAG